MGCSRDDPKNGLVHVHPSRSSIFANIAKTHPTALDNGIFLQMSFLVIDDDKVSVYSEHVSFFEYRILESRIYALVQYAAIFCIISKCCTA